MYDILIYILLATFFCVVSLLLIAVGAWMLIHIASQVLNVYHDIRNHFKK